MGDFIIFFMLILIGVTLIRISTPKSEKMLSWLYAGKLVVFVAGLNAVLAAALYLPSGYWPGFTCITSGGYRICIIEVEKPVWRATHD